MALESEWRLRNQNPSILKLIAATCLTTPYWASHKEYLYSLAFMTNDFQVNISYIQK